MNIPRSIERHRRQLALIVATLFAAIGLLDGRPVEKLERGVYRAVLRVLQPAESAVRRLIVVAARGIALKPPAARSAAKAVPRPARGAGRSRAPTFRLFDPRHRFASAFAFERPRFRSRIRLAPRPGPRIRIIDTSFDPRVPLFRNAAPAPPAPPPPQAASGGINAVPVSRRLAAIKGALADLARQARRYARWLAKPAGTRKPSFGSALRPGAPPGHRKKPVHKVDEILAECHWLARHVLAPDSS